MLDRVDWERGLILPWKEVSFERGSDNDIKAGFIWPPALLGFYGEANISEGARRFQAFEDRQRKLKDESKIQKCILGCHQ